MQEEDEVVEFKHEIRKSKSETSANYQNSNDGNRDQGTIDTLRKRVVL